MLAQLNTHFEPNVLNNQKPPIRVAIVGAAGKLGTYLCHFAALGKMFGPNEKLIL